MLDVDLRKLARRERRLAARIADLQKELTDIRDEIGEEMDARSTRSVQFTGGLQVTRVQPETLKYDQVKLRRLLTRRGLWDDVLEPTFSIDRLAALVQEGKIRASTVDKCSDLVKGTAYVRVTDGPGK